MAVKPVPDGCQTVTPYLVVRGASRAIAFYERVFDAKELFRMPMPDGRIGHCELQVGTSRLMLADEALEAGAKSPELLGGSPITLHVYDPDVDAVFARAVGAGATVVRPVANQFYGDRNGGFRDPFGHTWFVSTHVEDVSPEEMSRRMAAQQS